MNIVILILLVVVGLPIFYVLASAAENKFGAALKQVATDQGLHFQPKSFMVSPHVSGVIDGRSVRLDTVSRGSGKSRTTCTRVQVSAPVRGKATLSYEGLGSGIAKAFKGNDIQIGVPAFDDAYVIRNDDESAMVSYLGHATRSALFSFTAGRVSLREGQLTIERPGQVKDVAFLNICIEGLVRASCAMTAAGETTAERLRHHAKHDPEARFRARCLRLLLGQHGGSQAQDAAEAALDDDDAGINLIGARYLKNDAAFAAVCRVLQAPIAEAHVHAAPLIIEVFGDRPALMSTLVHALGSRENCASVAILNAINQLPQTPPVSAFAGLAASNQAALRQVVARLLGRITGPESEALLVGLLNNDKNVGETGEAVIIAAADGLASVGTIAAVQPLMQHSKGVFKDAGVKEAARAAIADIQGRLQGAHLGQLSLSERPEGELSLAETEG